MKISCLLRSVLCLLSLSAFTAMHAQPWLRPAMMSTTPAVPAKSNLRVLQDKFNAYWSTRIPSEKEGENREEGGYQQFKRWEWFMEQRTYPSGNPFDPEALFKAYQDYEQSFSSNRINRHVANWQPVGPAAVPSSGGGSGRINVLRVVPGNNSTLYIGSACGGVWKSTNAGTNWTCLDDFLPSLSVADIAINPRFTDTLYVATGDGYGYEVSDGFWGGTYSAGVLMSPDGGLNWYPTGLTFAQTSSEIVQRLVVKPDEPEVLLASTRNGLFRSADAGLTWVSVRAGHHYDIEFRPSQPDTVFASDQQGLIWSTNGGLTWSVRQNSLCTGRLSLAISPNNPNRIYMLCEDANFYRSDDLGLTLQTMTSPTDANLYGYYDAVLTVSPTNANVVLCGGLNIVKSTDGGATWTQVGASVHADQHFLDFQPGSGLVVYSCNDGGAYRSANGGSSWLDISHDLRIKQYYRLAQSSADPYTLYAGAQDNGTDQLTSNAWSQVFGGDGMDCMVDYTDDQQVYVSYQNGAMQKSTNGGLSFSDISPSSQGEWVTPFAMHPQDPNIIYAGYEEVYKSIDGGMNWNTISSGQFNASIYSMDVSFADPSYIYAATLDQLHYTPDDGTTWYDITAGLPVGSAALVAVTSSATDPHKVWVVFSGYAAGQKVYYSSNAGSTWTNVSGSLPNIPVNCILYQRNSPGTVYIGTDFGVFYRDSTMNDWLPYATGLPNVIVEDLDIQYSVGKLRAATYGRGLWESDLVSFVPVTLDASLVQVNHPVGTFCNGPVLPELVLANNGTDTIFTFQVESFIDNSSAGVFNWTGALAPGQQQAIVLNPVAVQPGQHTARFELSLPNGAADQNPLNDAKSSVFILLDQSVGVPVAEDFETQQFPSAGWNVLDQAGLYRLSNSAGGFAQSAVSLFANCYDIASGTARLIAPVMDFSAVLAPVQISFDVAYATYSAQYHDSLVVSISTDCGATFYRVYAKGDDSLATAAAQTSNFVPVQASDWRHEVIDVSGLAGQPDVIARFEVISGYGNDVYIDNININAASTLVNSFSPEMGLLVFPNPSANGHFSVRLPGSYLEDAQVELTDDLGRICLSKSLKSVRGGAIIGVDASACAAGVYRLAVISKNTGMGSAKVVLR